MQTNSEALDLAAQPGGIYDLLETSGRVSLEQSWSFCHNRRCAKYKSDTATTLRQTIFRQRGTFLLSEMFEEIWNTILHSLLHALSDNPKFDDVVDFSNKVVRIPRTAQMSTRTRSLSSRDMQRVDLSTTGVREEARPLAYRQS